MKKIVVTCDRGLERATGIANTIKEELEKRNIQANVVPVEEKDVSHEIKDADVYVTTIARVPDYGIPVINAIPFIAGIGRDKQFNNLLKALRVAPLA